MKYAIALALLFSSVSVQAGEDGGAGGHERGSYLVFNLGSSRIEYNLDYMNDFTLNQTAKLSRDF